jgi:hypothetical protein
MTLDAAPRAWALASRVVAFGADQFGVGAYTVSVYPTGPICNCEYFRAHRREGACAHIDAVRLAQEARAAMPPTVVIAQDSVKLQGTTWVRCVAQQDGGRVSIVLELFDGRTLAVSGSARLHPHQLRDLVNRLDRIRQAVGA